MTPPPLDTDVAIETPEHIVFRYKVAGPARRALAYLIDMIVCYAVVFAVALVVAIAAMGAGSLVERLDRSLSTTMGAGIGLILLLLFAAQWVYFVVWESISGTSLGKLALGIRVVTTTGRPIGFGGAALRNILRGADALPVAYAVGVVSMLVTSRFQRLGDIVAGTMVVFVDRARAAAPLRLSPPAEPGELERLPESIVLDADERGAIELFLRRRTTLGRAREIELAELMLEPLALRYGVSTGSSTDAPRLLALVYDRAMNAGRGEAPVSLRAPADGGPRSWR